MKIFVWIALTVANSLFASAFTIPVGFMRSQRPSLGGCWVDEPSSSSISLFSDSSSSILVAQESWRQYVPLVVSLFVIVDIVLGSPVLKSVTDRINPKNAVGDGGPGGATFDRSRERVDTEQFAKEAIEKAQNALELRRYLEENKTDEQRYQEIRSRMDAQMSKLDTKLEERRQN